MFMYEIASALVQDMLHAFLQMKPSTTDLALGKVNFEKNILLCKTLLKELQLKLMNSRATVQFSMNGQVWQKHANWSQKIYEFSHPYIFFKVLKVSFSHRMILSSVFFRKSNLKFSISKQFQLLPLYVFVGNLINLANSASYCSLK